PAYMPPEQATGDAALFGPTIDVYSLGVLLYEMLTGHVPFQGATPVETLRLAQTQEPVPPRRLQPGLPRDLQTICLKCLEKDPPGRSATARALADALRRFLDGRPIEARSATSWERAWLWSRRQPRRAALVASVFLTAVVGVAGILGQWQTAVR